MRVYDYADLNVPMLARMFDRRCRGYEAVGYTMLLPASAIPGWPADVVLPSDPVWKRDYAASVRRLVRDGVDTPLAHLFVHAARVVPPDADGAARARSATEAFLYRRLDTLAETKGRFGLNVALPIAFDGASRLEVDLLCADCRVAWSWTALSILGTRSRIVATDAKTNCCRRTAIWCCVSSLKMWEGTWTLYSTQFCGR